MISPKDILHQIAVNIVHSNYIQTIGFGPIDFLKNFANAYLEADAENEEILRPAWMCLIKKYRLDLLQDIEEVSR